MPMMSYLVCVHGPCANDVIPQSMASFRSRWCNRAPIALSPLKRLGRPRLGDLGDGLDQSGDRFWRVLEPYDGSCAFRVTWVPTVMCT